MGYAQKFRGAMRFPDSKCLEAALDAFVEAGGGEERGFLEVDDLTFEGLLVRIDMDTYGPASMYDPTMSSLYALAEFATSGYIGTEFHLDGISRDRVHPGSRTPEDKPRHYRWDIMRAADSGDVDALRELQKLGVDLAIKLEHRSNLSPLHLAARAGADAAVELLLAAGIPVDVTPDEDGVTPLGLAVTGAVAQRLVAAGADVNHGSGESAPITRAAIAGHDDVVLALIAAGAIVPEVARRRVLEGCCRHAKLEALLALVKHDPALVPSLAEASIMQAAMKGGEPVIIDFLLSHGAALPETFLVDAIEANAPALLEMALRAPDALAKCGDSSHRDDAMVRAARKSVAVMEVLVRHGVPVHPATPGDTSPIHAALESYRDHLEPCVDWLFAHGAPRDAVTTTGATLMQKASSLMKAHLVNAHGFDAATIDRSEMAAEDVETMDRLLASGARKRADEQRKIEREATKAQKAIEREQKAQAAAAAKVQKEADKAKKAEAAAAAKAQKEAEKLQKAAAKAQKAEAAAAAKAQKAAAKAQKSATD